MAYTPANIANVQRLFDEEKTAWLTCEAQQVAGPLDIQLVPSAAALTQQELAACLGLIELTSGQDYKQSRIGWNVSKKKAEMRDPAMMYVLVRPGAVGGEVLGFVSFMFTYDDPPHEDRQVVYLYEIHLHEHLRGMRLGSKLVAFVEKAARQAGISKTMLTVFAANSRARGWYEKLGYGRDACSPEDRVVRSRVVAADYVIMSKELV
jgi:ribosomal protein S18 acetylase RimI-like enzyme